MSGSQWTHLALAADLHAKLLAPLCGRLGQHCNGIEQAALKHKKRLCAKQANKLAKAEFACHFIRHLTYHGCCDYVEEVRSALGEDSVDQISRAPISTWTSTSGRTT